MASPVCRPNWANGCVSPSNDSTIDATWPPAICAAPAVRTRSIGLLLSNVINPLDGAIQRAIEEAALDRDVVVIASSIDEDAERERAMVGIFTARRVDGLIIKAAGHDQSYLSDQRRMNMAMVFVDRPPAFLDADTVVVDNEAGTARGIAQLIANGHRRIGYLGALHTIVTAEQRVAGYRTALADGTHRSRRFVDQDGYAEQRARTGGRTGTLAQ